MVSGRSRWLDSGLEALAAEGPGGLKIDRLVRRVGLTKGSFFHHFAGAAAYQTALLERLEADAAAALDEASASRAALEPHQVLEELTEEDRPSGVGAVATGAGDRAPGLVVHRR